MNHQANSSESAEPDDCRDDRYVVVARRYRPQSFDELIGQGHVKTALGNAIETGRVGHAYLFAGPRGVGKTTTARIFSKALNCVDGPSIEPCNTCDVCQMISSGEDIDVIEIDGASNNGIDEIRTLRRNVSVLPSRCRFKIYIIDEVHMLSRQAFNGLLKTLEEPPEHVKFMFCTTDPDKIPITVLSRCQRFDLVPVHEDDILKRLQFIVKAEGRMADDAALDLVARRAHGSMRDSQSLLEQLMAFCSENITADDVHGLLGTTASGRILELIEHLSRRDAAAAIGCLHELWKTGSEPEQVAQQVLGVYRDILAVAVGGGQEIMGFTQRDEFSRVQQLAESTGKYTLLAALEILQEMFRKLRSSVQVGILIEMTLIRIATLEELDQIQDWLNILQSPGLRAAAGNLPTPTSQPGDVQEVPIEKKNDIAPVTPPATGATAESAAQQNVTVITPENLESVWESICSELDDLLSSALQTAESVTLSSRNHFHIKFPHNGVFQKETCERPERCQKLKEALRRLTGETCVVTFELLSRRDVPVEINQDVAKTVRQRSREAEEHPLVQQMVEVFDAEIVHVVHPR